MYGSRGAMLSASLMVTVAPSMLQAQPCVLQQENFGVAGKEWLLLPFRRLQAVDAFAGYLPTNTVMQNHELQVVFVWQWFQPGSRRAMCIMSHDSCDND